MASPQQEQKQQLASQQKQKQQVALQKQQKQSQDQSQTSYCTFRF